MLKKWEQLPEFMRCEPVREYYDILAKRKASLLLKRGFDVIVSLILLIVLSPVFLLLALAIKLDSPGPVFFRQVRVTQYGRHFHIFKFRTMVEHAEQLGTQVTLKQDPRITRVGAWIRKLRLDEICQLIDVLRGTMTFVGTRPEVPKYVEQYSEEMRATLLLPAGVTSLASILYKDEDELLQAAKDSDRIYIEEILPQKMRYNLEEIRNFSFIQNLKEMFQTVLAVLGKEYEGQR